MHRFEIEFNLEKFPAEKFFKEKCGLKRCIGLHIFYSLKYSLKKGIFAKSFEKIQIWKFATYLKNFKSLKRDVDVCIYTTYKVKFRSKNFEMKCGL